MPEINGPPIRIRDRGSRTDESRRPVRIEEIRTRDQRNQLPNGRVGRRCALLVAEDEAVQVDALPLPEPLVCGEKKRPAANDRATDRPAELVPVEGVRILGRELEEVACVERIISKELERLAAEGVAARSGDDVDNRAGHVTVLGAEHRVVDLEFLDARERRLEHQRPERQVVGRHAVDLEPDRLFTIAGGVERERTDASNRPRREPHLRGRHRSGHEQAEIGEVATVERDLLHGLGGDDMADGGAGPIDQRRLRTYDHRLGNLANRQVEVSHQRPADVDVQRVDALGAKSCRLRRDRVGAVGNGKDVVTGLGIRANRHIETAGLVLHADDGARNERSKRVEDAPLQ